jgi:hypothetical protein
MDLKITNAMTVEEPGFVFMPKSYRQHCGVRGTCRIRLAMNTSAAFHRFDCLYPPSRGRVKALEWTIYEKQL